MAEKEARLLSVALAVWLLASSYAWPHTPAQYANTWLTGLGSLIVGSIAMGLPPVRRINTALGVWLVVSVFVLPHTSSNTGWNNALVGIVLTLLSLVGPGLPAMPGASSPS